MKKTSYFYRLNYQNGQALLIVVLIMVIALTVGLSIASKSITSFRNSTDTASSQKALFAAEAGIEQALKSNTSIPITSISQDVKYSTAVSSVAGQTFLLNGGNPILQDSGTDLWLTYYASVSANLYQPPYYPSSGSFTVYWGDSSGGCNNAALEVVILAGTKNNPVLSRYAFDPCQTRSGQNGFTFINLSQGSVAGKTFYYQATIPVGNGGVSGGGGLISRIVPIYTSAVMGVNGTSNFPPQGSVITSVGTSGTTQRKVNVFQGYPEIPAEYYLYNLFVP
ncbi:MAG: pilus assembly PilX N-terminal domain-containing protein [Patescibacteria group bacterium]|nr:pilus assembly PilX N-terminal domain-containing protein [Patescibacteria group bacterium]